MLLELVVPKELTIDIWVLVADTVVPPEGEFICRLRGDSMDIPKLLDRAVDDV